MRKKEKEVIVKDSVKPSWGGNRIIHYLLFIGSPFLFFVVVINFVGVADRFGFSAQTIQEIWISHIIGSFCVFLVTYGLFAMYHSKLLTDGKKHGTVILLIIVLYFWYGLLSLPDHQYWTEGVGMVPVSFFLGIIVILFGLIPSALTAVFSDIFKRIFLKFAPKRGRYYWMIVTVLMGVMLSVIYGLGLKEGRDIWFFIDISLFCTLYSIFFLSLQDYYKHRNNQLIQRSFEDDF